MADAKVTVTISDHEAVRKGFDTVAWLLAEARWTAQDYRDQYNHLAVFHNYLDPDDKLPLPWEPDFYALAGEASS